MILNINVIVNFHTMGKISAHVIVSGRVQGVCFRDATRRAAQSLGVAGWVKNLHDGRVEAVFEGEEEAVKKAMEFVRRGPPLAAVDDVKEEIGDYSGAFSGFEIF